MFYAQDPLELHRRAGFVGTADDEPLAINKMLPEMPIAMREKWRLGAGCSRKGGRVGRECMRWRGRANSDAVEARENYQGCSVDVYKRK